MKETEDRSMIPVETPADALWDIANTLQDILALLRERWSEEIQEIHHTQALRRELDMALDRRPVPDRKR